MHLEPGMNELNIARLNILEASASMRKDKISLTQLESYLGKEEASIVIEGSQ